MNAEGASPVHTDSKRRKAPRPSSSRRPSRGGVASAAFISARRGLLRAQTRCEMPSKRALASPRAGRAPSPRIGGRSDDRGCSKGERGGDCTAFECRKRSLELRPPPKKKRESAPSGATVQPSLGPSATTSSSSPPKKRGSGLRAGRRRALASFAQQARACGAGETRKRNPFSGARIRRSRTCPCVERAPEKARSCRSRRAARGSSGRFALSACR